MGEQDSQQNPSARLLSEMRQVLAEMSLLQYGKTQAFDASGGKSENPDPRPSGESWPLADKWAERWTRAHNDIEREGILGAARSELQAWKVRQAPAVDTWDEKAAILEDGEGFNAADVARRFSRSTTYVMKLRRDDDREAEFGLKADGLLKRDDRERVLNLASQGCTLRQIEMQTGKSRETVRRWLKDAA